MKRIPVLIYGAGGVGQSLLQQIVDGREQMAARNNIRFDIVALADSKSWLWEPSGLSDEQIAAALAAKKKRLPLGEDVRRVLPPDEALAAAGRGEKQALTVRAQQQLAAVERINDLEILAQALTVGLENGLVVDVTAAEGMEPLFDKALDAGYGVVMANKYPLAGDLATGLRYLNHPRVRYESTVGGGQPVIAMLRYLLDTNDPLIRVEGQISGTLGFICRRLDEGEPFSRALAVARARGHTEPDPREDLGGRDVMRKLIIMGRMAGWPMNEEEIYVEPLYPPSLAHLPVNEFMAAAVALDPSFQDRVNAAAAAGEVLRHVGELERGKGAVSLKSVPVDSPLANMKYISFVTGRYEAPIFIGGQGGGVASTAAGVVGDMIGLVREMRDATVR